MVLLTGTYSFSVLFKVLVECLNAKTATNVILKAKNFIKRRIILNRGDVVKFIVSVQLEFLAPDLRRWNFNALALIHS